MRVFDLRFSLYEAGPPDVLIAAFLWHTVEADFTLEVYSHDLYKHNLNIIERNSLYRTISSKIRRPKLSVSNDVEK